MPDTMIENNGVLHRVWTWLAVRWVTRDELRWSLSALAPYWSVAPLEVTASDPDRTARA